LSQAQKIESVGRLAGGVAHDYNNMLSVIIGNLESALARVDPADPIQAELQQAQSAAQRSADLTRQLLGFARKQAVVPKVLNLNDVVTTALNMLRRLVGEQLDVVWMPSDNLWSVKVDPGQVDQILVNLATNARDAVEGVGQITIRTENVVVDAADSQAHPGLAAGRYVVLEVADNGRGMDREVQLHIFEPFYTTKADGAGTGLGLATVYGIVKQNNGFINVYSEPERGTTVKVFLPRVVAKDATEATIAPAEAPQKGAETILLVEDEPMVLRLTKTLLERLGYTVLSAGSPREALRIALNPGSVDLLISDMVMPELNGRDLAEQLVQLHPSLKCLFVSGYPAHAITPSGVLPAGMHFLQKPFTSSELAVKVREALK
jgi:two-component system cell cycle sensor histidine kinase/response regulator CckA